MKAWPEVRCLEDVALVQECRRLDLRVRHCPQVRVWTSAREQGRVELGLSSQLREWNELQRRGQVWLMPGADELRAQAVAGAALRHAWNGPGPAAGEEQRRRLAALWLFEPADIAAALAAPTLGLAREWALEARHERGQWFRTYPAVPLKRALPDLRVMVRALSTFKPEDASSGKVGVPQNADVLRLVTPT